MQRMGYARGKRLTPLYEASMCRVKRGGRRFERDRSILLDSPGEKPQTYS